MDVSDPASPRLVTDDVEGVFYWPTPALIENVLYTVVTGTPDGLMMGGLGIVDVSEPANPILVNTLPMEGLTVMGLSAIDRYLIEEIELFKQTHALMRTISLLFLLVLVLAACRQKEEAAATLEATKTAVAATATPGPTVTPLPTGPEAATPEEFDWPPQVVYTSPGPGEEVSLAGAITVRFDQPMDQKSVEAAFGVAVAETGAPRQVAGTFSWARPDTFVFTPRTRLERKQQYEVNIAATAAGLNGRPLREPVYLKLETIGFLEVSQVIPADGTEGIQTDAALTVLFNRPVVPLVTTSQQAGLPQPLQIEPATPGQGQWVSTSIYRFVPDSPLDGATRYQVSIVGGLEDMTGGLLAHDFNWSFTTIPPSVVSVVPENRSKDIIPTKPITITFNMPMDQASTEAAVSLDAASGGSAAVTYDWSDESRLLVLQPEPRLDLAQNYTLRIGRPARSAGGQAALDRETSSSLRTVPFPAVIETYPADRAVADRWQQGFSLRFASPMVLESFEDGIVIEPAPDKILEFYFDDSGSFLYLNFELKRSTTYSITIPASAADPYGNTLGEDYTWTFHVPEAVPIVSMNLSSQLSQLSTNQPTEVNIIYRNVPQINARLYDMGIPARLLLERYYQDYRPGSSPIQSWTIPVEKQADTADVYALALADGGTLPTGVYFLHVDGPGIRQEERYWQNQRNVLIIADANLVVKELPESIHVWVTNLSDGQPAAGHNLTFYDWQGRKMGTAVTGSDGLASLQRPESELSGVLVVSNQPGQAGFGLAGSNWNREVEPWQFGLNSAGAEPERFAYLYTDRPIYRPGDIVHFRGIVRDTNYGRYPLPTNQLLTLGLEFSTNYEQIESYEFEATLDENGEFSGQYQIPADARLGDYRFYFQDERLVGDRAFSVAEYRKPEFQVTVTAAAEELLRAQDSQAVVEASYFFGGPATDLPVYWNIYADGYRLPWEGPYYSFGDDAGYNYVDRGPFYFDHRGIYGQGLGGDNGLTDGDGRLVIDLPANLLDTLAAGSYKITVEATVSDISNFPITARTEIVFHEADTYVGLRWDDYVATAGTDATLELITAGWDSQPKANQEVEVIFYRREWRAIREVQNDRHYTRYEPIDTEVARGMTMTDSQGKATVDFVPPEDGSYIAVATVTDEGGRSQASTTALWAVGSEFIGWRTDTRAQRMDLVADQQAYRPGDTAQILVQSPFAGPARAWLTIERGEIMEQRVITLHSNSDVLSIPITEAFAPNVFVSVLVVKGVDAGNAYANMRLGVTELIVSPEHLALKVSLTPQSDVFQPGDTVSYDVQVTDSDGNPVAADISLALVDLAVLTLKPDNAPPIVEAFFARQPIRSLVGAGLVYSGEGLEIEIPIEFSGGGGGDGGAFGTGSFALEDEDEARRNFPDTAFWEAKVRTDRDGRATIAIPLPDTVTTWRLSSKAVTIYAASGETLVGQASVDVVASLPLLIRPVTPRFFTVGDMLELGAVVHNNTGNSLEVTVSLEADGLALAVPAEQTITIPAEGRQLLGWPVTVADVEFADLTFRAASGAYRDATKPSFGIAPDQLLPVVRFAGEDVVGTAGVLDAPGRRVEAILLPPNVDTRQGEVQVQLSPSLAAAMTEALAYVNNLMERPACAHAVTDQLLPNVATARALRELNLSNDALLTKVDGLIRRDIGRLERLQKSSGGWGWCYTERADDYLTAYTLLGLLKAQEAGYEVSPSVLDQALKYLSRRIKSAARLNQPYEINRQAFFLYLLAEAGDVDPAALDDLLAEHRALLDPYAKALMALAYDLAGGSANNRQALLADLNDSVVLSASGAHWQDARPDWNNLSSDIRGTAIVLGALARLDVDNPMAANAVRWLMVARTAEHWTTGQDTAWSILALTDWMVASGELNADYGYQVNVNADLVTSGRFTAANVTGSDAFSIPMDELLRDEVNFLDFRHEGGDGRLYYSAFLDSFILAQSLDPVSRGISVQRHYFDAACDPKQETCQPIGRIEAGQTVRVELTIIAANDLVYAVVEDHIPAGAEAIDPGLATSAADTGGSISPQDQDYEYGYWGWWYFNYIEYRDDRVVFYSDFLPAGTYQYTYTLQTTIPGQYQVIPAIANQEFFPDVFGRSEGLLFTIFE